MNVYSFLRMHLHLKALAEKFYFHFCIWHEAELTTRGHRKTTIFLSFSVENVTEFHHITKRILITFKHLCPAYFSLFYRKMVK